MMLLNAQAAVLVLKRLMVVITWHAQNVHTNGAGYVGEDTIVDIMSPLIHLAVLEDSSLIIQMLQTFSLNLQF
jgi:hypothetical protein